MSEVGLPFVGIDETTFCAFPAQNKVMTPAFADVARDSLSADESGVGETVPSTQLLFLTLMFAPP